MLLVASPDTSVEHHLPLSCGSVAVGAVTGVLVALALQVRGDRGLGADRLRRGRLDRRGRRGRRGLRLRLRRRVRRSAVAARREHGEREHGHRDGSEPDPSTRARAMPPARASHWLHACLGRVRHRSDVPRVAADVDVVDHRSDGAGDLLLPVGLRARTSPRTRCLRRQPSFRRPSPRRTRSRRPWRPGSTSRRPRGCPASGGRPARW